MHIHNNVIPIRYTTNILIGNLGIIMIRTYYCVIVVITTNIVCDVSIHSLAYNTAVPVCADYSVFH